MDNDGSEARLDGIRASLQDLAEKCDDYRRWHFKRAQLWGRIHLVLGIPAAILAAIAGVTGLASTAGRVPAAAMALAAAGLGAAASFLDSRTRAQWHDRLAGGWMVLGNEAEIRLRVDMHDEWWVAHSARQELEGLLRQRSALLDGKLPVDQAPQQRPGPAVP